MIIIRGNVLKSVTVNIMKPILINENPEQNIPSNIVARIFLIFWRKITNEKTLKWKSVNEQLKKREKTLYGIFRLLCELIKDDGGYENSLFVGNDKMSDVFYQTDNCLDFTLFMQEIEDKFNIQINEEEYDAIMSMKLFDIAKYIYKKTHYCPK